MATRRRFMQGVAGGFTGAALAWRAAEGHWAAAAQPLAAARPQEDVFTYLMRTTGGYDRQRYQQILGAANDYKEGDQIVGVSAADASSRRRARQLLANTTIDQIAAHPPYQDDLHALLQQQVRPTGAPLAGMTLGQLRDFLIQQPEQQIQPLLPSLSSDVIACVVKLMTNQQLCVVGAKVFHPLPGTQIGAKGYLGARVQPNSPTDNLVDIRWQVFDAFAYAVGDVLLGTNPVSSEVESVAAVQTALQEILVTFGIDAAMPHCVLAHVDVQAKVEAQYPGSTQLWFQSIAGTDGANETFDISVEKMLRYADQRKGRYGFYFETGQGADFTNGHGNGFDMVLHESRKYGFARALAGRVQQTRSGLRPWVHLNDVAGFIGPEVFRTREQLVRCCLEDIVMGKLHGLCIGLDVCSTLHMDVSLADLDWCLDQIMPANPAYLMALPTKIDPMLGYLTTGYQDHLRLRHKFGYKVNDAMWRFFQRLQVVDQQGRPTSHFGDPVWVYIQYRRAQGDNRSEQELRGEAQQQIAEVRGRGVFIAEGHGDRPWQLAPALKQSIERIYDDAKASIWAELTPDFVASVPSVVPLSTRSADRNDYILHPESGESLALASDEVVQRLRRRQAGRFNVQVVISDGLNAHSISDEGHLEPYLQALRSELQKHDFAASPDNLLVNSGRVRAGYRIGETLFGGLPGHRAILHVIGERPGTGHHTFSIYLTAPQGTAWAETGNVDHNITKVVSGVARTALQPAPAAVETVRILAQMVA